MQITVNRIWSVPDTAEYRATTTGVVLLDDVQCCFSLEPTDLMIPADTYQVALAWSDRFQRQTPHVLGVENRTAIEMHGGNWATDSDGCVLCAEHRINDYEIQDSPPATTAIENALREAELRDEINTITIQ